MSLPLLLVLATVILCAAFAGVYVFARRIDNYGVVDVAWSYAFAVVAVLYGALGAGDPVRRGVITLLVVAWSLRLGTHLYRRVKSHHPVEDGRYVQLRRDWSADFGPRMFRFFQMQAVSVVLLALPVALAVRNPTAGLHPLELAGIALWLVALAGESLADAQLAAFKRDPAQRGRVCNLGLWRYSRHPNYFFEWLVWVAYFVFACGSPFGWLGILSPAIILYLLLRVTGIPLTEEQSVRSKGDAYREYQRTTSAFVPWFPRR